MLSDFSDVQVKRIQEIVAADYGDTGVRLTASGANAVITCPDGRVVELDPQGIVVVDSAKGQ